MAPHSSTLAWKIPWTEEPGGLQSVGSQRVRHDWVTSLSLFTFMHWRRKCNPLWNSCLENSRDGRAWWAAVYGVAQNWTRPKQLSSSSSSSSGHTCLESLLLFVLPIHLSTTIKSALHLQKPGKNWLFSMYTPSGVSCLPRVFLEHIRINVQYLHPSWCPNYRVRCQFPS